MTVRVPDMAVHHGAQQLYDPDEVPPRLLAQHMAECQTVAETVLTGVTQAGYHIARPPALCPDHGLPRCLRCRHDGVPHDR